uniref:Uncharacterized protein n=1 Tax=Aegilops tauschii subsp. strangulata TaxID=200361 RepID=A0A452ZWK3_AEGTS
VSRGCLKKKKLLQSSFPPFLFAEKKKGNRGSSPEMSSAATKLATAADTTSAEAQTLVLDMRKALSSMKSLAVEYERAGKPDKVKQLEDAVQELVASYEDCAYLAEAVKKVPGAYQPSDQVRFCVGAFGLGKFGLTVCTLLVWEGH